jgi:hypothetical protein
MCGWLTRAAENGSVYMWGSDAQKQLGNADGAAYDAYQELPTKVLSLGADVKGVRIAAGHKHTVLLDKDGAPSRSVFLSLADAESTRRRQRVGVGQRGRLHAEEGDAAERAPRDRRRCGQLDRVRSDGGRRRVQLHHH